LFSPPHRCLMPPREGTPCDINIIYTLLKSIFSGLQLCQRYYGSIFIRLVVVAFQNHETTRNSDKIWPYSSSRSSKVIDLGVNWKPRCDFLLVINSNFGRISYLPTRLHHWTIYHWCHPSTGAVGRTTSCLQPTTACGLYWYQVCIWFSRQKSKKALRGSGITPFLLHLIQDLHTGITAQVHTQYGLLHLIQDLHTGIKAQVHTQYGLSDMLHATSGVRQGCILAPALFCCSTDWLMRHCNYSFGIDVWSAHLTRTLIDYADDAVLFTADPNNWVNALNNFEHHPTPWARAYIQTGLKPRFKGPNTIHIQGS